MGLIQPPQPRCHSDRNELARQRFLDEQARAAQREAIDSVEVVEKRHLALVFLPFGAGQLLAAAVLYWTLERGDGEAETLA